MSETFVSKAVDENGDGFDVQKVVQVGSEGTSGMITDDSATFRVGNVESEVFRVACATPDRGSLSNNGSNK